jgi:hypothetical protein
MRPKFAKFKEQLTSFEQNVAKVNQLKIDLSKCSPECCPIFAFKSMLNTFSDDAMKDDICKFIDGWNQACSLGEELEVW